MDTSFEHSNEQIAEETVVPKEEPVDHEVNNNVGASNSEDTTEKAIAKKSSKKKPEVDEGSEFEPSNVGTEDDDFSIAASERDSFVSFEMRNATRLAAARKARAKYEGETDDEFFAELPRRKLKRACKNPASRAMVRDLNVESSTSPDEFDERIHVRVKTLEEKIAEAEAKKKEQANRRNEKKESHAKNSADQPGDKKRSASPEKKSAKVSSQKKDVKPEQSKDVKSASDAQNAVKREVTENEDAEVTDTEMGSPSKKVKSEPNLDDSMNGDGSAREHAKNE